MQSLSQGQEIGHQLGTCTRYETSTAQDDRHVLLWIELSHARPMAYGRPLVQRGNLW